MRGRMWRPRWTREIQRPGTTRGDHYTTAGRGIPAGPVKPTTWYDLIRHEVTTAPRQDVASPLALVKRKLRISSYKKLVLLVFLARRYQSRAAPAYIRKHL